MEYRHYQFTHTHILTLYKHTLYLNLTNINISIIFMSLCQNYEHSQPVSTFFRFNHFLSQSTWRYSWSRIILQVIDETNTHKYIYIMSSTCFNDWYKSVWIIVRVSAWFRNCKIYYWLTHAYQMQSTWCEQIQSSAITRWRWKV